ncbi:MAG: hypothetical protein R3C10_27840 [Pirellulales bacterium]
MPSLSIVWSSALLVGVAALPGCGFVGPTEWATTSETLVFDLDGVERFQLYTSCGKVEVIGGGAGSAPEARLVVTVKAGGISQGDAAECLDAIELAVTRQGESDETQDVRWDFVRSRRPTWTAQVDYRLELPDTIQVNAKAHNGSVRVDGVSARCVLQNHNGPIVVDDAGDEGLVAHTHNGALTVTSRSRAVDVETHNGSVEVKLTNADHVSGNVSSHNGGVQVELAEGASANLVCRTYNGRVSSSVPLTGVSIERRTRLEGTLGSGGDTLELRTHNGSVAVELLTAAEPQ